jgi:hypothetical protein
LVADQNGLRESADLAGEILTDFAH